jgi:hypothetical protein
VVDKEAPGQDFSEYFGFSCQFAFHQMLYTYLSFGAGTIGQLVAGKSSGLSLTPLHKINKLKRRQIFIIPLLVFRRLPFHISVREKDIPIIFPVGFVGSFKR